MISGAALTAKKTINATSLQRREVAVCNKLAAARLVRPGAKFF
jgi:hypothetical protein